MKKYEEVEHTADWSFRAFGADLKELFENAAIALFALEGALDAQSTVELQVKVAGSDREALLVNWLSELLYLQETRHQTFQHFSISELSDTELAATIKGAPAGRAERYVKAITYHELRIGQSQEGWQATIVVDV